MLPTTDQLINLRQALQQAYDFNSLRMMLFEELNESIEDISLRKNLTEVAFDVVHHFAAQPSGLRNLAKAAHRRRPDNQMLGNIAREFDAIEFDVIRSDVDLERLKMLQSRFAGEFAARSDLTETISVDAAFARHISIAVEEPTRHTKESLNDLVRPGSRTVLTGLGGSGKTTTLLWMAAKAAESAQASSMAPIALYGRLRTFDAETRGFDELISLLANSSGLTSAEVDTLWRQHTRPVIFLLDGLHEVDRRYRKRCIATLIDEFFVGPHAFVVSSRPSPEAYVLAQAAKMKVVELANIDENGIKKYVETMGREDIKDKLTLELRRLLGNPFMLWAYVSATSATPPTLPIRNQGQLLRELVDGYIFGRLEAAKPEANEYSYELVKKPFLAWLAGQMAQANATRVVNSHEFLRSLLLLLDDLEKDRRIMATSHTVFMPDPSNAADLVQETINNGIVRAVDSSLEFSQDLLQDYFTAVNLVTKPASEAVAPVAKLDWRSISTYDKQARQYVMRHSPNSYVDALTVLCGIIPDASAVVQRLLDIDPIAAAKCLSQATNVDEATRVQVSNKCQDLLSAWHPNQCWIGATMALVSEPDQPEIVERLEVLSRDEPEWQVRSQAFAALSRVAPQQLPFTSKDWAALMLDDMLSRIGQAQWSSGKLGPTLPEALQDMLKKRSSWNWRALIQAADSHADRYIRGAATLAIRLRAQKEEKQLLKALVADDKEQRLLTAAVLGWGRSLPAVAALVNMLADPDIDLRVGAMLALVKIRADESIPELTRCAFSLLDTVPRIEVQAAALSVLAQAPIEPGRLKAAAEVLERSIAAADPATDAEGIIAGVKALAAAKRNHAQTVLDKLSAVAKHAEKQETRSQAFDMVLQLPGGRNTLMQPIYDRLENRDYQGVINEVGEDEPFVSSPNLFLWRGMAFYQLGRLDRAIDDIGQFLSSANNVSADIFAFYYSLLHGAGETKKLTDAKAEAKRRLTPEELKKFHDRIAKFPEP
jgi:tetratricopeptide (TPR) repeat protein